MTLTIWGLGGSLYALLVGLLMAGAHVMLGFCVYYDAQYRHNENAAMWGALSGVFFWAAAIYLILRVLRMDFTIRCQHCGEKISCGAASCPRCGETPVEMPPELSARYQYRRRLFLWLFVGCITALTAVVITLIFLAILSAAFGLLRSTLPW